MTAASIEVSEESGVRFLHFGSEWVQGAMRIQRPFDLALEYTREMMGCLLFNEAPDWPRRALLIGLGAGSLTKFLYRHRPGCQITVVEIDPRVVGVAHSQFKLPHDPARIEIVIDDGAHFVRDTAQTFDLILVDGFDENAQAGALVSEAFYRDCRARLNDEGMVVANLFGRTRGHKASFIALWQAFEENAIAFPSSDAGNSIALARKGAPLVVDLEALKPAALALKKSTGLNLSATLGRLAGG
ncbi:MAG: hypothetical protein RIR70_666 [Pseudomonadota bacterium]|jgi:spermidine synthase